jgi:hypothetical protein
MGAVALLPKCPHGVYLGGSRGTKALYCGLCNPEGTDGTDVPPGSEWRTCERCGKTRAVISFRKRARVCLDCSPRPRATVDTPERRRERSVLRRDRAGDFTWEGWLEKLTGYAKSVCTFCERPLNPETAIRVRWVPLTRGGKNDLVNITPACERCAKMRAASWPAHESASSRPESGHGIGEMESESAAPSSLSPRFGAVATAI